MESKYAPLELKNQFCFPIYLCSKEIIHKYTPLLDELNLTYTQFIVMSYFWERRSSNVKDISETLLLDPSTLTPLLKKLEKKGYISRSRSTIDERNLSITVTESGLNLRDNALILLDKVSNKIALSETELQTLYKLIFKVLKTVKKEGDNANTRNKK